MPLLADAQAELPIMSANKSKCRFDNIGVLAALA